MQSHRDHLKTLSLFAVALLAFSAVAIIGFDSEDSDATVSVSTMSVSEYDSIYGNGLQEKISANGSGTIKLYKVTFSSGDSFSNKLIGYVPTSVTTGYLNTQLMNYGFTPTYASAGTTSDGKAYSSVTVSGTPTGTDPLEISYLYNIEPVNCFAIYIELQASSTIPVTSISITGSSTVEVGSRVTLSATSSPTGATDRGVTWTVVSGSSYVSISGSTSSTGGTCQVTGVKAGTATVRATATDGSGVYKDYSVTVQAVEYTFDLYYNANGGSGAPSSQSYTGTENTNHTFTISSTKPTRDGYLFLGWSTSSSASTATYQPGGTITVEPNDYERLYAVWQQLYTYVFEFNANGGTGGPTTPQTYSGKTASSFSIDVPASVPTKSGSTFLGWSESSTATTPTYTVGGGQITITATGSSTTKTLYAVWSQEQITVSGGPSDLSIRSGSSWSYTPNLSVSGATISVLGASWLSVVDGKVIGTPTTAGTYDITLTFSKSGYTSGTQTFTVTVVPSLTFDSAPTGGVIAYAV